MTDNVNHPAHYTSDKSGVECIEITRHRNFNIGNAIKYLWRAGIKDADVSEKHIEDLEKAIFYITREIENIKDDLEDAEDFEAAKANADWVRKLFAPIFDEALSAEEYDKLAASKADHPAGKNLVGNEYIENVFDNITSSGINYDEVIASSLKKYNDSRDRVMSKGIRVEDCEVVEDYDDEEGWACNDDTCGLCDEVEDKTPPTKVSLYEYLSGKVLLDDYLMSKVKPTYNSKLTDFCDN